MPSKTQRTLGLAAAACFCLIALGGCRAEQPEEAADDNLIVDEKPAKPLPVIEAPYDRARMLMTIVRAASAYASGENDAGVQRALDGKQFKMKLRFGCDGQGPIGDHGWSVDPDGKTLRLRAVPTLSLEDEVVRNLAMEDVEAAEGFWLDRPWLLQASCPSARPETQRQSAAESTGKPDGEEPEPKSKTSQRVGIAQFFGAEDSRTRQRLGKAFEAVVQPDRAIQIGANGFDLVISGRLRARRDGRVILCSGNEPDQPPDCIVSADIDRVWIENPDDKAVMAEWSV